MGDRNAEAWLHLIEQSDARPRVGDRGVRDPAFPCDAFVPITVPFRLRTLERSGPCESDGHYLCDECTEIKRCPDCGLRLSLCGEDSLCGSITPDEERCARAALFFVGQLMLVETPKWPLAGGFIGGCGG